MSEPTPDLAALADSVREIERHVADAGWDGPVRVFALVRTQEMLRTEPGLAAQLDPTVLAAAREQPWHLTSVEQEELPAAPDLETLLAGLSWPSTVDGMAVTVERVVLPPAAEEAMPQDTDAALEYLLAHPERQDVRLVVGALRDGPSWCAVRSRANDTADQVGQGPDLVPGLVAAVRDDARVASCRAGRQVVGGAGTDRRDRLTRLVQGRDAHHPQTVRHVVDDLVAVRGRGQEPRRTVARRAGELLPDAADRTDLAGHVDGAGPRDVLAVRLVLRRHLVDDAEREHRPGAGTADVVDADGHVHGHVERGVDEHPDLRAAVRLLPGHDRDVDRLAVPTDREGHGVARRRRRRGAR